jgi:hypothetical protein
MNVLRKYSVLRKFTVILTLSFTLLLTINTVWSSLLILVLRAIYFLVRENCILH